MASRSKAGSLSRKTVCGLALALALSLAGGAAQGQEGRCHLSAEEVYREASPRVMEIFADAINPYLVRDRIQFSLGTGFVFQQGILVTNYHVVADAQRVALFDGVDYWPAEVMGVDPLLDIAVLNFLDISEEGEALDLAPPESLAIGQQAFAIGFPHGIGKSITQGIVTGMGRVLADSTSSWLSPLLQTDTTVNPGNSGGPLLDDCARVIGMVSRASQPDMVENTAFAIPVEVLRPVVEEIVQTGHVSRAWHGLYGQMVEPPILALLGVPYEQWEDYAGFMVETVEPGSAAAEIGLKGGDWPVDFGGQPFLIGGDIITEVNGTRILDRDTALSVVRGLKVGQTISLVYKRGDQTVAASVTLKERPILEADLDRFRGMGN